MPKDSTFFDYAIVISTFIAICAMVAILIFRYRTNISKSVKIIIALLLNVYAISALLFTHEYLADVDRHAKWTRVAATVTAKDVTHDGHGANGFYLSYRFDAPASSRNQPKTYFGRDYINPDDFNHYSAGNRLSVFYNPENPTDSLIFDPQMQDGKLSGVLYWAGKSILADLIFSFMIAPAFLISRKASAPSVRASNVRRSEKTIQLTGVEPHDG